MKQVDIERWHRRSQYEHFSAYESPHFNLVADVDIGRLLFICQANGISSYAAIIYLVSKVSNGIEEFRYRIRGEEVVLHDAVHPSFTVMSNAGGLSYCSVPFSDSPSRFLADAKRLMDEAKSSPSLAAGTDDDHYLYMSCLPWVKFTSISHAMRLNPTDSIPRFSWGKYSRQGDSVLMPLSVQVHHALADGVHVGQFYQDVEHFLECPEELLLD